MSRVRLISADWPGRPGLLAGTFCREAGDKSPPDLLRDCLPRASASRRSLPVARLRQVHGTVVAEVQPDMPETEADACVSHRPGRLCLVRTADCLPVLFYSEQQDSVAAAHAGWRGLAGGVLEATVRALPGPAAALVAWLGPAISQPCFEVGPEVRDRFLAAARPGDEAATQACFEPGVGDRWQADLYALARLRLAAAGVEQVYGGGFCTYSDADRFHSYRRDGAAAGRLYSVIYINPSA